MSRLSYSLVALCLLLGVCQAEPPRPRLRFPGVANNRPLAFLERQEAAPYPPAGHQPEPPFEIPAEAYGPPAETYGPPAEPKPEPEPEPEPELAYGPPDQTYGPPAPTPAPQPEVAYGPPDQTYGPPAEPEPQPELTYGPPNQTYGPPEPAPQPDLTYGPPTTPAPQREPHDTYGPPPPKQPEDNNALPQTASILDSRDFYPQTQLTLPRVERLIAFRPRRPAAAKLRRPPTNVRVNAPLRRPAQPQPANLRQPKPQPQFQRQPAKIVTSVITRPEQGFAQLPPALTIKQHW